MTPHKGDGKTHKLPRTGEEQISTYVEAVRSLLKSYATHSDNAKVTSDMTCLKKASTETSVQFSNVLRSKAVPRGNAYPEEHTRGLFIDAFPANIQKAVRTFWHREKMRLSRRLPSTQTSY